VHDGGKSRVFVHHQEPKRKLKGGGQAILIGMARASRFCQMNELFMADLRIDWHG
jgi:hypothetical protein